MTPTPQDRLAQSRERLRQAMRGASAASGAAANGPARGSVGAWLHSLRAVPGAAVVVDALGAWWARHPLRVACMVAADAANTVLRPIAQRHPLVLVLGAFGVGGLLAWSQPWRGLLKPALFAGLLPQLLSKAMARVPPESWMAVLASLAQEPRGPSSEAPAPVPSTSSAAAP